MQGSKDRLGSPRATASSSANRSPIRNGPDIDSTVRACSAQAEPAEIAVQLVEVGDPGDRGGEAALDRLDRALGVGFLVAVGRQAIAGIEDVVARQRGVAGMGLAAAPREDELGHGLGVVPPDLPGNGGEEVEGGHHAGQDGFGAFGGQREDERVVGVGPDGDEEGDLTSAIGKVDLNVPEIGFEPMSRRMGQGDEGFTAPLAMRLDVALDLTVAASVSVFITEAAKHLLGGVPLLGRGLLVIGQDLVDDRMERTQDGCGTAPGLKGRHRLGLLQDLPDLVPRMMEGARNLADAHAIAMRPANCSVIVHRKHVLDLREVVLQGRKPLYEEAALGWDRFTRSFCPRVGPFYALITSNKSCSGPRPMGFFRKTTSTPQWVSSSRIKT